MNFTILGLFLYILGIFFEIYFDRNIMYLDQSTLRHQGQNRAFEAGTCKNQEFQYHFSSVAIDLLIISTSFSLKSLGPSWLD